MDRDTLHAIAVANANWHGVDQLTNSRTWLYPTGSSYGLNDFEYLGISGSYPMIRGNYHVYEYRCNYCNVKNEAGDRFCAGCGAPL